MTWAPLFPLEQASDLAGRVDVMFYTLLALSTVSIGGITATILYFCVRYRQGSSAPREVTRGRNIWVELISLGVPLVLFLGIFTWGALLYTREQSVIPGASQIFVVGKQWMWEIQHPEGQRELDELHLPVGVPVRLVMTSQDVIHSFYLPAFRLKQDLLPGRYTSIWLLPSRVGSYPLLCAEFCGTDHSLMGGKVVVQSATEYQAWLDAHPVSAAMPDNGVKVYRRFGCPDCHEGNAAVAPSLHGLYGHTVTLSDGSTAVADETYLRDSILDPGKQRVHGYRAIMPSYDGQIDDTMAADLISYLKTLQ